VGADRLIRAANHSSTDDSGTGFGLSRIFIRFGQLTAEGKPGREESGQPTHLSATPSSAFALPSSRVSEYAVAKPKHFVRKKFVSSMSSAYVSFFVEVTRYQKPEMDPWIVRLYLRETWHWILLLTANLPY
jgi:hypothetical protein